MWNEQGQPRWGLWLASGGVLFLGLTALFAILLQPDVQRVSATAEVTQLPADRALYPPQSQMSLGPQVAEPASEPPRVTAEVAPPPAPAEPIAAPKAEPPAPPAPNLPKGPLVALIVQDLGESPAFARQLVKDLPAAVALGFTPYGTDLAALAKAARNDGHEVWLGVPMQPSRYPAITPGPRGLLTGAPAARNRAQLAWMFARMPGEIAGVYNIMGSSFTTSRTALDALMPALSERGVAILDARSGPRSEFANRAQAAGLAAGVSWRFLGEEAPLAQDLAALAKAAKADGRAVALARVTSADSAAVTAWADGLAAQGVTLVPPAQLLQAARAARGS
jgi:uncharacterized protein